MCVRSFVWLHLGKKALLEICAQTWQCEGYVGTGAGDLCPELAE